MSETQSPSQTAMSDWLPASLQSHHSSSQLMYELFEGNPDMVFIVDDAQRIVAANTRALKEFGYREDELFGQPVSVLLPEAARDRHAGHVRSFLAHPSVRSMGSGMDLKGRDAHGNEFPVDVMLRPFAASSGQYVVAVCRRPDEALARSQMQVRALVDSVREYAINLLDPQGRILTWNEGARRIHGLKSTEALGKNFSIFFLEEDIARGEPERLLAEAAQAGHAQTAGWRRGAGNVSIWAEVDFTAIRDASGQLTGFTRVLHDMTAHRKAEEALREAHRAQVESEERFRLMFEQVTDYAILMLDTEGRVTTWNMGAERTKGYTREEVLGKCYSIFFLPEDAAAGVPARNLALAARDGYFACEGWRQRKDGSKFWALATLTAIHGLDGELRGFAKVTRDMTAQKEADEALRSLNAQLERYRIIVENIDEYAIYTLDPEGIVTAWGAGAQKSIGYSAGEVVGRHYSIFFLPEDVKAGAPQKEIAEAARTGRCLTDGWRITKDRSKRWASGALSAVRGPEGGVTGFVRVSRDMTQQKMMEDSLAQLNADLEQRVVERTSQLEATVVELQRKNEEVEAFVYIVSHDLRAPLVNVQGFVRELEMSCTRLKTVLAASSLQQHDRNVVIEIIEDDISGALRFIAASSSKFERLIEALLGLSRQGRRIYRMEPIEMRDLVENAIAAMQQMIEEAPAVICIGSLPPVVGDRTALDQVFSNLIANSIKYRSEGRPLRVELGGAVENNTVHFWVRDNGSGIPESGKAKLFQVFQRLHPQKASGEGMGLAIVHRIVERHGGRIWAESEENAGTTFHFTIPASQPAAAAEASR